jgi:hypothetical protein
MSAPTPLSSLVSSTDPVSLDGQLEIARKKRELALVLKEEAELNLATALAQQHLRTLMPPSLPPPPPATLSPPVLHHATGSVASASSPQIAPEPAPIKASAAATSLQQAFAGIGLMPERTIFDRTVQRVAAAHHFGVRQVKGKSNDHRIIWVCTGCDSFRLYSTKREKGWQLVFSKCSFEHERCEGRARVLMQQFIAEPALVADLHINPERTLADTAKVATQVHGLPTPSLSTTHRMNRAMSHLDAGERTLRASGLVEYGLAHVRVNPRSVFALSVLKPSAVDDRPVKQLIMIRARDEQVELGRYTFPPNHYGAVVEGSLQAMAGPDGVEVEWAHVGPVARAADAALNILTELSDVLGINPADLDDVSELESNVPDPNTLEGELLLGPDVVNVFVGHAAQVFAKLPDEIVGKELTKTFERFTSPGDDALQLTGIYLAVGNNIRAHALVGSNVVAWDGGHLKPIKDAGGQSIKGGVVIVASSLDSQRHALPLGFCVVSGESACNIVRLASVLQMAGFQPTPVSVWAVDQGTGIEGGLLASYPHVRLFLCLVHLLRLCIRKFKCKFSVQQMNLVRKAQAARTQVEFAKAMQVMKTGLPSSVHDYFDKLKPSLWASYTFYDAGIPLDGVKNSNMVEIVFAFMLRLGMRHMDGPDLVHAFLCWCSHKIFLRAAEAAKMNEAEVVVPRALRLYQQSRDQARFFSVTPVENKKKATVSFVNKDRYGSHEYCVDLEALTCPCKQWWNLAVPCSHSYATAESFGLPQADSLAWRTRAFALRHHIVTLRQAYAEPLIPVMAAPSNLPSLVILPLELEKKGSKLGRPQQQRFKGAEEGGRGSGGASESTAGLERAAEPDEPAKKPRKPTTCSTCNQVGHRANDSKKCSKFAERPLKKAKLKASAGIDEDLAFVDDLEEFFHEG